MSRYDRKKGVELFNEVYCGKVPLPAEEGQSPFLDYMLETLFGTLWADATLSIRDRRLLLIGAIAAQGDPTTLTIQLRSALLRDELTPAQLDALSVFLTQYVGYPKGSQLFMVCNAVKAEVANQKG